MSRRRVVVTGLGIISPVGIDVAAAWDSILNARSGIARVTRFDASAFPARIAGEVKDFDVTQLSLRQGGAALRHVRPLRARGDDGGDPRRRPRGLRRRQGARGRVHRLGHRRPADDRGDADRPTSTAGRARSRRSSCPASIINMISGLVSIQYGYQGPNLAMVTACSTANHSIGEAGRHHRVRRRRRHDRRRRRGDGEPARHGRFLRGARAVDAQRRSGDGVAARGTSIATASCWARAPACWCWRSTSTPGRAEHGSTASSPATG